MTLKMTSIDMIVWTGAGESHKASPLEEMPQIINGYWELQLDFFRDEALMGEPVPRGRD